MSELPEKHPVVGVYIETPNLKIEAVIKGRVTECLWIGVPLIANNTKGGAWSEIPGTVLKFGNSPSLYCDKRSLN